MSNVSTQGLRNCTAVPDHAQALPRSWVNTMKLAPGYAFQLFSWDYVIPAMFVLFFLGLRSMASASMIAR